MSDHLQCNDSSMQLHSVAFYDPQSFSTKYKPLPKALSFLLDSNLVHGSFFHCSPSVWIFLSVGLQRDTMFFLQRPIIPNNWDSPNQFHSLVLHSWSLRVICHIWSYDIHLPVVTGLWHSGIIDSAHFPILYVKITFRLFPASLKTFVRFWFRHDIIFLAFVTFCF